MSLTAAQRDAYQRDGVISRIPLIDSEEAIALGERHPEFQRACRDHFGEVHWFKTYLLSRWIFELVTRPRLLDCMESLLGPNLLLWGADMFYKPPRSERFTAMHQDSTYWGLEPVDGLVNAWIALSPSNIANGCLRVVPGTHRHGQVQHANEFAPHNVLVHGQSAIGYTLDETEPVELEPGDMTIFHLHVVHGSGNNTTDEPRLGLAVRYICPELRQTGLRDSALLVRGEDCVGHFDHEKPPAGEFDEGALAQFREAIARPSGAGNSKGLAGLDAQRADKGHEQAFRGVAAST
jgi:non-heme Fe2+,alpha-ketoglutarate-dependent halogenase